MDNPVDFVIPILQIPVTRTVTMTWVVMAILTAIALIIRLRLDRRRSTGLRTAFEAIMEYFDAQIREIVRQPPDRYFPLAVTLFLFILVANLMSIVPGLDSPTQDLACTAALAIIVFLAVPYFGIRERGVLGFIKGYVRPSWIMLPFNIIGDFSRTLALAFRLYGNIFAGAVIVWVLVKVGGVLAAPIAILGLLTGLIQAYIFAILTLVYIGGAVRTADRRRQRQLNPKPSK